MKNIKIYNAEKYKYKENEYEKVEENIYKTKDNFLHGDFYEDKNDGKSNICYLEFSGTEIHNIKDLINIVGKHVYNEIYLKSDKEYVKLVIE